jgi:hypothetical protein
MTLLRTIAMSICALCAAPLVTDVVASPTSPPAQRETVVRAAAAEREVVAEGSETFALEIGPAVLRIYDDQGNVISEE